MAVELPPHRFGVLNEQFDCLLTQINQLRFWHECLWDAVELVDWRSGEIRGRAINQWLAEESLKGIKQLPHPRIQKLAERLEKQLPEMLTFLDGIAQPLLERGGAGAERLTRLFGVPAIDSRDRALGMHNVLRRSLPQVWKSKTGHGSELRSSTLSDCINTGRKLPLPNGSNSMNNSTAC